MPGTYSALSKAAFTFFDLDELSAFIDSTYWYFLKAQANGVLLRWLNELLAPRISPVSSRRHSLHYHTEQTHACVESQIPATDISRGTEKRWLHPTYIHPTQACLLFQLITHTNMHTQSHYRWIHIIVTVQGEHHSCMHITELYNFN